MYQLLLISHYLRRRMIPLFAALAVTLCTAMVIIVMSVMGGFLGLMETGIHKLTGDVIIGNVEENRPTSGFSHYDELIRRLEQDPAVARATPTIQCGAQLRLPGSSPFLQVVGVDGQSAGQVMKFEPMWSSQDLADQAATPDEMALWNSFDLKQAGKDLHLPARLFDRDAGEKFLPAAVLGVEVNPDHYRDEYGQYNPANTYTGKTIRLALMDPSGNYEPKTCTLPVANELKSGFFEADKNRIYVPFDWLQDKLGFGSKEVETNFDPITGQDGQKTIKPARCTQVLVAGKPGVPLEQVQAAARQAVADLYAAHPDCGLRPWSAYNTVTPWNRIPRIDNLLSAVKNEKGMMTFLFAIIGVVAVMMVAITFYMIVLEKTRDIGILRAIGASWMSILSLFVRYGLVIGILGSAMGLGLAVFVVTHLNNLQKALGYHLVSLIAGAVLLLVVATGATAAAAWSGRRNGTRFERGQLAFFLSLLVGGLTLFYAFRPLCALRPQWLAEQESKFFFKMWDPRLYYFDAIPDQINWHEALTVAICAIVASVMGALIPAVIAATKDPVEALRHE